MVSKKEPDVVDALKQLGWIRGIDYVYALVCGLCAIMCPTLLVAAAILSSLQIAALGLFMGVFGTILSFCWIVTLLYRTSQFVLALTADIKTLPEDAARTVIRYYAKP